MKAIEAKHLARFRADYENDPAAAVLHPAVSSADLSDLAYSPLEAAKLRGAFTIELKTRGITAQQHSGRCWMFAVMNILREKAADTLGLDEFELSGNFLAFFDKLEKSNNFLESIIRTADKPLLDREVEYILNSFHDGGYWDMAVDLVKKYGAVPKKVMPETFQSTNTERFTRLLNSRLRACAAELRALIAEGKDPEPRKEEMLSEIYRAECIVFGEPPTQFDFEYRDKDGVYHAERDLTPKAFYKRFIGLDLDEYITVTDHPTSGLPANYYYQFHYIGSMAEGRILNLNLTTQELEDLCLAQVKGGEPVWFGCDSKAFGHRANGIWDPASLPYGSLLGGLDFSLTKGERLEYHDSYATHAMLFVGVNLDKDGQPNRWKIENSWGGEVGDKGYFVCSRRYFREYVYEAIINKKHLSPAQRALLDAEPAEINAWESDWK
ncbi:MAG: C1 family peptidase [Lachnospiraceae bacterium]|nr:C1 family peptidase [Lachnospiraceae bacterium]